MNSMLDDARAQDPDMALIVGFCHGAALAQSVRVTTNMGPYTIELQADRAPLDGRETS